MKFELTGTSLKGYVNGTLQCSATDPSLTTGKIACYGNNIKATFDDVTVR